MRNITNFSIGLLAWFAPLGAQAHPVLRIHEHVVDRAPPLLAIDPAIGLILTVAFWVGSVRAIEALAARRAPI